MGDIHNWYRVIGLYIALHVVLFLVECYKYKHSHLSWIGFKEHEMYSLTYLLVFFDMLLVIGAIILWAIRPLVFSELPQSYY